MPEPCHWPAIAGMSPQSHCGDEVGGCIGLSSCFHYLSFYLCLSTYLSGCLSFYLSIYLSIYLFFFLFIHPSIHPSTSLSPGFCVPRPEQHNTISWELNFISGFFAFFWLIVWTDGINNGGWCLAGGKGC